MTKTLLDELLRARQRRIPCALVTVAETRGSVPREAGSKMIVYADGRASGSVGGGKFEALVIEESIIAMRDATPKLKSFPLHEGEPDSFGAICGGEVTVLIEPQVTGEALVLVGAGHCSAAIAKLARACGFHVTVIDDRPDLLTVFADAHQTIADCSAEQFINRHPWVAGDALVMVSRNYQIDLEALHAALGVEGIGYIGMIGSKKKVRQVFDTLRARGVGEDKLTMVYAPLGLDIGADSPEEIAVSVLAEILAVLRGRSGASLRLRATPNL